MIYHWLEFSSRLECLHEIRCKYLSGLNGSWASGVCKFTMTYKSLAWDLILWVCYAVATRLSYILDRAKTHWSMRAKAFEAVYGEARLKCSKVSKQNQNGSFRYQKISSQTWRSIYTKSRTFSVRLNQNQWRQLCLVLRRVCLHWFSHSDFNPDYWKLHSAQTKPVIPSPHSLFNISRKLARISRSKTFAFAKAIIQFPLN